MPTWRPRGSGWRSSSSVVSNSASVLSTRSTPAWRRRASTAASSPSAPAVCDSASPGRRPRLPLTARIGFSRETRREICEKRRGLPKDSTYSAMTSQRGSSAQYSRRSFVETSARLPSETKAATPSRRAAAWPSSASPSAPDCDDSARPPRRVSTSPSSACRSTAGSVLTRPMLFGPTRRTPRARAAASSASSRSRPSGSSVSEKPVATTSTPRAPASAASTTASSTSAAGTDTSTSSGGSPSSPIDGTARIEDTTPPPRLTAAATPENPPAMIVRSSSPPTLPSRAEAPTTATDGARAPGAATRRRPRGSAGRCAPRAARSGGCRARGAPRPTRSSGGCRTPRSRTRGASPVVGHDLGVEAAHAALRADLGELLEHAGREAAALHVVRDGERDLRDARLVQSVVARDGDDPPAEPRDERHPEVAVGVGVVVRDDVVRPAPWNRI